VNRDASQSAACSVGRAVVALTEATATVRNPATGTVTTYRNHNKPALGQRAQ
jgi:hypothetical protein